MRLIACSLLLTLAQLSGCNGTNCADGDCAPPTTDTASESHSDSHTSQPSTGEPTGTTGEPGTDSATSTTGTTEPGTTTLTTGEPGTTTTSTTEPGTSTGEPGTSSSGTTGGGLDGEPSKMEPACAPDDGPATEFKIGLAERLCSSDFPEDAPIFRVVVFTGPPPLAPGEYKLDNGNGFATFDDGNGVINGFLGTLTITDPSADGVKGTYDITLDDASNLAGEFDAIFCDADILCG
jgi:hypothetical protein